MVYMVEQAYIFKVGTVFTLLKDTLFYTETVKPSYFYGFIMSSQALIIPGVVLVMLYKLLLSNLVNAALLSVWFNLSNVWFYRRKDDSHYRVEFHEVGWHPGSTSWHDAHKADTHAAPAADNHGHGHH